MIKRNMRQTLRVHNRKSYIMTHSLRMSRCLEADTKPRDIESDRFASGTVDIGKSVVGYPIKWLFPIDFKTAISVHFDFNIW